MSLPAPIRTLNHLPDQRDPAKRNDVIEMKPLKELAANLLVVVAVLSAATMATITVRREFFRRRTGADGTAVSHEPTNVEEWRQYSRVGHRIGPSNASVTIVEFADFECPVCRAFATQVLPAIKKEFGDQVTIVVRHWPLSYHKFAYPTARAAECAAAQGKFESFYSLAYAEQDSLGLKPYRKFAQQSGVKDLDRFDRCVSTPGGVLSIDADIAAVKALGGEGTPTVLVNNLLYKGAPDSIRLHDAIIGLLQHRSAM